MDTVVELSERQFAALRKIVTRGAQNAASVFSQMVSRDIRVSSQRVDLAALSAVPDLAGGAEEEAAGICLSVSGDVRAHILMLFPARSALLLADVLLEKAPGTTTALDEMSTSALAEAGNITGSFFLNALSDYTRLSMLPSPPAVECDMAGAMLSTLLAPLFASGDKALVVETMFSEDQLEISGILLMVPDPRSLAAILDALGADR